MLFVRIYLQIAQTNFCNALTSHLRNLSKRRISRNNAYSIPASTSAWKTTDGFSRTCLTMAAISCLSDSSETFGAKDEALPDVVITGSLVTVTPFNNK